MEQQPQMPEHRRTQSPEEIARFQYESRLQQKLAALAFPNEPVPLMRWAENTEGYSARFRAWLEEPGHPDVAFDDEVALAALLERLHGPTVH